MLTAKWLGHISLQDAEGLADKAALSCAQTGKEVIYLFEHPPTFRYHRWDTDKHAIHDATLQELWRFEAACASRGIAVVKSASGGGMMYHGPGQLILCPVLHLKDRGMNLDAYITALEETMIRVLKEAFGIQGLRNHYTHGSQGVWVRERRTLRKIGFLGARWKWIENGTIISRGCALNLDPDMEAFSQIDPCNLPGVRASSVKRFKRFRPKVDATIAQTMAETFAEVLGEDSLLFFDNSGSTDGGDEQKE